MNDLLWFTVNRCAGHLTISDNPPSVSPYFGECAEFVRHRRGLPIYQYRQQILDQLVHQQVVIITGEVGSGKTTQVPQYILENANEKNIPCRIVSIQTRRISALAASERVTAERGNYHHQYVGFVYNFKVSLFCFRYLRRKSGRPSDSA